MVSTGRITTDRKKANACAAPQGHRPSSDFEVGGGRQGRLWQIFPHHPRKWRAQILPGARPGLPGSEEAEKRSAGLESRPPDARFISPGGDGVKVAETDAEGFAGPSVRQRPLAGAEEQLYGVLGDRGGKAKGPFEELAEVRGTDYLGHHRCIVL
jgi:hypothetical protein